MEYENLDKDALLAIIKDKDKEISDLESEINDKNDDIEKLENENQNLEDNLQVFEDLKDSDVIIKQINILTTDEIAKIYYAIQDSYHFQHLDKFKPL